MIWRISASSAGLSASASARTAAESRTSRTCTSRPNEAGSAAPSIDLRNAVTSVARSRSSSAARACMVAPANPPIQGEQGEHYGAGLDPSTLNELPQPVDGAIGPRGYRVSLQVAVQVL